VDRGRISDSIDTKEMEVSEKTKDFGDEGMKRFFEFCETRFEFSCFVVKTLVRWINGWDTVVDGAEDRV
jgi:hypothetical protein